MRIWPLTLVFIAALTFSQLAHARPRVPLFFNFGDELFEVGPFPKDLTAKYPGLDEFNAGWKCQHFGIFWADV
jgi:hypothetical protein